ncbi:MAG: DUF6173 family protein [Pseudomonadota bacterium]|jgi:hypothetical protein|uniref:Uncharacterized protein n=1 Tax=Thalassovita autumnalis TaxID=2072972 RepID=A0A0P1FHV1_9RHOB|nr:MULTISPECIES: DUF6173 family protein [Thalassovita]MEC8042168.1 DUF6173 family protein [Pseudomonadota bacterium]MEC8295805.1 DUF6173 family protein [Pseudomonadota bacterium]CUH67564.1 hypothetical protein TL5118_02244 [Thalassovita autumnalis]CUH73942.1 hypothetical protein TL5120_03759 [Thalassovita autumnalis]
MDDEIRTSAEVHETTALPRRHEVHADPDAPAAKVDRAVPAAVAATPVQQKSAAQWAYERLILYIQNFEQTLDQNHEVAMGFAGSNAGVLRIEGMGYFDPDIVTFYGSDEAGTKTQLVQHVSQLSVILRALQKQPEAPEPNRIGFRLAADLEKG